MCIINVKKNADVNNTKILACKLPGGRQLIAYANNVDMKDEAGQMILPVPKPHTVEFYDLTNYAGVFDSCAACFNPIPKGARGSRGVSTSTTLEVVDVGSYRVSIVPTLADFGRLSGEFVLNPDVLDVLRGYSRTGLSHFDEFGFIVCRLKTGDHDYHPLAYSHDLQTNGNCFIPTKHYHGDGKEEFSDFDHVIYTFDCSVSTPIDCKYTKAVRFGVGEDSYTNMVSFSKFLPVEGTKPLTFSPSFAQRKIFKGKLRNVDLEAF